VAGQNFCTLRHLAALPFLLLRLSWAQLPAPKFLACAPPPKPLFKILLTLGGDVNGNKVQN
jgi:hypothetical protein